VNVWRAIKANPDAVAAWADYPVTELDLHARHRWLITQRESLRDRLVADPLWYDAQIAGWWLWGASTAIGDHWFRKETNSIPYLGDAGRGVNAVALGYTVAERAAALAAYLQRIADTLRTARITCGDWTRVVTPAITTGNGVTSKPITALLLDPPYQHADRTTTYGTHDHDVFDEVWAWAIQHGNNPMLRIALCGYEDGRVADGWECVAWQANGGYANTGTGQGSVNKRRERIWFSPHCVKPQLTMF
jgi:DNA adenine methylase